MPAALLVFWAYVKKYWYVGVAILGTIMAAVFFVERQPGDHAKKMDEIDKAHDLEIQQIQSARTDESQQNQANAVKLQQTLTQVQQQYQTQNKALDDEKKNEIALLIQKHGDNEDEMLKQLSEAAGFPVVLTK